MAKALIGICMVIGLAGCQKKDEIQVVVVAKDAVPKIEAVKTAAIQWTLPSGWKETAGDAMRIASFEASDSKEKVEISIVQLAGDAGGLLANINRWRGQLGLESVAKVEGVITQKWGSHTVQLVKLVAKHKATIVAILKSGTSTIFVKMTGLEQDVQAQNSRFESFVKGLNLHE